MPEGPAEILLTFDDGPHPDLTPRVLDLLDRRGIKAVFFVNGWRIRGRERTRERAVLRDIIRRGHLVGNHTIHHYFLCGKRGQKIAAQEIEGNAELIEQTIGMRPVVYRTPYGSRCKSLKTILNRLGIQSIGWDIDPQDWQSRSSQEVLQRMRLHLRRLRGRSIVLFHDVQPATVAALPRLFDWLDQENQRRQERGRPGIRIIDYGFLLPDTPLVPPLFDELGRLLIQTIRSWPGPQALLPLPEKRARALALPLLGGLPGAPRSF